MTVYQRGGFRRAHCLALILAALAFALYASKADARPSYGHLLPSCVAMPCDGPMGALPGLFSSVIWEAVGRPPVRAGVETGRASWYGHNDGFHGRKTASGERFNKMAMTAAHRTRRLGSHVTVTNLGNGRSVRLRVTDRGPAKWTGKIIDVSYGAAQALGFASAGVARVRVE